MEDLSSVIAVVDQKDTPFTSRVKKGKKPGNTLMDWQADGHRAARNQGTPDGKPAGNFQNKAAQRKKLHGRIQHFRDEWRVTTLAQEVSNIAGVPEGEEAKSKATSIVDLKRDMEFTFLSADDSAEDDGVNGLKTRGVGSWLSSTQQADPQTAVPTDYLTPAGCIYTGALSSFGENELRGLMQTRWEQTGATPSLVGFSGSNVKNIVSDFARYDADKASSGSVRQFEHNAADKKLLAAVDFYEGDFGHVEFHLSSFLPDNNTLYILDMELCERGRCPAGRGGEGCRQCYDDERGHRGRRGGGGSGRGVLAGPGNLRAGERRVVALSEMAARASAGRMGGEIP